jgi:hypothetical protein
VSTAETSKKAHQSFGLDQAYLKFCHFVYLAARSISPLLHFASDLSNTTT